LLVAEPIRPKTLLYIIDLSLFQLDMQPTLHNTLLIVCFSLRKKERNKKGEKTRKRDEADEREKVM